MADLSSNISDNAQGPAQASDPQNSMRQHPLPDQIEADRYLKANAAASANPTAGVRFFKIRRGGAVNFGPGDCR